MAKKKTVKKTAAAKPAPVAKKYKFTKVEKARTKSEIFANLAENTDMTKKDIAAVFDCLSAMIAKDIKKAGPQMFTLPGLAKITVQRKPKTKARPGVNPFTGEKITIKAKPARNVVKVRPLKGLKEMV